MGTIQFDRNCGKEIWNITSCEFSITPNANKFKINIWVESYYDLIQKLEETGETPNAIEVVFPIDNTPEFTKNYIFRMPKYEDVIDNWDEDKDYYCNWYYFEHRDIEDIKIEIGKTQKEKYRIKITGIVEDPTDSSSEINTKLTIEFETTLKKELNGYWAS